MLPRLSVQERAIGNKNINDEWTREDSYFIIPGSSLHRVGSPGTSFPHPLQVIPAKAGTQKNPEDETTLRAVVSSIGVRIQASKANLEEWIAKGKKARFRGNDVCDD